MVAVQVLLNESLLDPLEHGRPEASSVPEKRDTAGHLIEARDGTS
jgi:hypothetical protein